MSGEALQGPGDQGGHPVSSTRLTEHFSGAEAWNSGLERMAGALGSATATRKEPGETAGVSRAGRGAVAERGPGGGRGPRGASPCALFRLWSRCGQAGCCGPPALWFRAQPSERFHRPRPLSKSVAVWWSRAGSGAPATTRGLLPGPPASPGLC